MARWRPRDRYELLGDEVRRDHLAGGVAAVRAIVSADGIPDRLARDLLNMVTWYATEHPHKYQIRWRSAEAVKYRGKRKGSALRHEHVFSRKWLIDNLLEHPGHVEDILKSAIACLVRKGEAARLDRVPDAVHGWERYRAAGIEVLDMAHGARPVSIDELIGMYPVPDLPRRDSAAQTSPSDAGE